MATMRARAPARRLRRRAATAHQARRPPRRWAQQPRVVDVDHRAAAAGACGRVASSGWQVGVGVAPVRPRPQRTRSRTTGPYVAQEAGRVPSTPPSLVKLAARALLGQHRLLELDARRATRCRGDVGEARRSPPGTPTTARGGVVGADRDRPASAAASPVVGRRPGSSGPTTLARVAQRRQQVAHGRPSAAARSTPSSRRRTSYELRGGGVGALGARHAGEPVGRAGRGSSSSGARRPPAGAAGRGGQLVEGVERQLLEPRSRAYSSRAPTSARTLSATPSVRGVAVAEGVAEQRGRRGRAGRSRPPRSRCRSLCGGRRCGDLAQAVQAPRGRGRGCPSAGRPRTRAPRPFGKRCSSCAARGRVRAPTRPDAQSTARPLRRHPDRPRRRDAGVRAPVRDGSSQEGGRDAGVDRDVQAGGAAQVAAGRARTPRRRRARAATSRLRRVRCA